MDAFTWSMPFVVKKVSGMLFYRLQHDDRTLDEELPQLSENTKSAYRTSLSPEQNETILIVAKLAKSLEGSKNTETARENITRANSTEESHKGLRRKARAIARMAHMFKTLQQEKLTVVCNNSARLAQKLSPGLPLTGKERLQTQLDLFGHAATIDKAIE